MATQVHEFKAKSVDEAIDEGLATLNVTRNDVDIEVIHKGSRGLFGIGSEPAVVHLSLRTPPSTEQAPSVDAPTAEHAPATVDAATPDASPQEDVRTHSVATPAPDTTAAPKAEVTETPVTEPPIVEDQATQDPDTTDLDTGAESEDDWDDTFYDEDDEESELAALAADLLDEMMQLMGFDAQVTAAWRDDEDESEEEEDDEERGNYARDRYLLLDVEGTDLGALIGRRGETLEHIQYLLRLMVNQQIHQWKNIVVDVEHYKERRITQVTQLAERMAEQVARTGKAISLEPMPANERRIVHMVLRNHPEVYTESFGEGARRKVHIFAAE